MMGFFIQSLGLYRILNDILLNFYAPDTPEPESIGDPYERYFARFTKEEKNISVLELDRDLTMWEQNLPPNLRVSQYWAGEKFEARQPIILRQR